MLSKHFRKFELYTLIPCLLPSFFYCSSGQDKSTPGFPGKRDASAHHRVPSHQTRWERNWQHRMARGFQFRVAEFPHHTLRGAEGRKMGKQIVYDLRWVYACLCSLWGSVVHKRNVVCDQILRHKCYYCSSILNSFWTSYYREPSRAPPVSGATRPGGHSSTQPPAEARSGEQSPSRLRGGYRGRCLPSASDRRWPGHPAGELNPLSSASTGSASSARGTNRLRPAPTTAAAMENARQGTGPSARHGHAPRHHRTAQWPWGGKAASADGLYHPDGAGGRGGEGVLVPQLPAAPPYSARQPRWQPGGSRLPRTGSRAFSPGACRSLQPVPVPSSWPGGCARARPD